MKRKWTKEEFIEAVKSSTMLSEVLRKLNIHSGSAYNMIYKYIELYGLDTSHFLNGKEKQKAITKNALKKVEENKTNLDDLLVEHTFTSTKNLKNRLLKENRLNNVCSICNINSWLDKPLSLQLDHINGNNKDNRIENLRLLCPNCHSQTDTYCGKNVKKKNIESGKTKKETLCINCNAQVARKSTWCKKCFSSQSRKKKIDWPSIEELNYMIENIGSIVAVAKKLGVSDKAVKKHIKSNTKLNIASPVGLEPTA